MKIRITCIQCSITLKATIATIAAIAIITTDTDIITEIRIVIMRRNASRSPRLYKIDKILLFLY